MVSGILTTTVPEPGIPGTEQIISGLRAWQSVAGDWNGDGKTEISVYKDGMWYLDTDGSGTWNAGDRANNFGASGWVSSAGDWNGDGKIEIGVTNGQHGILTPTGMVPGIMVLTMHILSEHPGGLRLQANGVKKTIIIPVFCNIVFFYLIFY